MLKKLGLSLILKLKSSRSCQLLANSPSIKSPNLQKLELPSIRSLKLSRDLGASSHTDLWIGGTISQTHWADVCRQDIENVH